MDDEYTEIDNDYKEPVDIRNFCRSLEQAWKLIPDAQFNEVLETIFDGYPLDELSGEELQELINDYLLQNQ